MSPVENQSGRIIVADISDRAHSLSLFFVLVQTHADQGCIRITGSIELEDVSHVLVSLGLLHHGGEVCRPKDIDHALHTV